MKHLSLSLTAKIVLLVALMGVASATITVYATWHMQRIESRYHQLMAQQDATTSHVALVRQHLAEVSALVHTVLTASHEDQILLSQEHLALMQQRFEANLHEIYALLPEHELQLDQVLTQSRHMFAAGRSVVTASLQRQAGAYERKTAHEPRNRCGGKIRCGAPCGVDGCRHPANRRLFHL